MKNQTHDIRRSLGYIKKSLSGLESFFNKNNWIIKGGIAFFSAKEHLEKETYELGIFFSPLDDDFFDQNINSYLIRHFHKFNSTHYGKLNLKIKTIINEERKFDSLYYGQQSADDLITFSHFKKYLSSGLTSDDYYCIINKLADKLPLNTKEKNELDLFFYPEDTNRLIKIPLPFLSTPTILLVINDIYDNDYDRAKLIRLVYYSTREALYNYIYNILVNNLQGLLSENSINSKDSLVINFVKEVCKVLLPVRLSVERQKEQIYSINYINEWQICDKTCNSIFDIVLKTEESENNIVNYKATFFLTSFHFPIKEQEINLDGIIVKDGYTTEWIHKMPGYELFKEQTRLMLENIFNLIYKQWKKNREAKDHATKAATSRIINRNYAHHIGSHVSHRATADKIFERIYGSYDLKKIPEGAVDTTLKSIVEMENRLTRYKDERNEFISGTDSNIHPVPVFFYKDIIQPFVENSLLMDNIAKSEGICWEPADHLKNEGQVKENGICKLRIRVFYHKDLLDEIPNPAPCSIKDCCCKEEIPCMHKASENNSSDRLSLSDLGIDKNWFEMMAIYDMDGSPRDNTPDNDSKYPVNEVCIHQLPYYKKLARSGNSFYEKVRYSLDDIEVAIPGTLGTHSIFSLLENHIRNTAKHAPSSAVGKKHPVNIILKISKRIKETGNTDPDFYNLEITSNIPTINKDKELDKITMALKEPVDIDTKALGFADMRINACLLAFKNINQVNLDSSIEKPHVYYHKTQKANKEDLRDGIKEIPRSVGFCMLLTKPCKILFIGEKFTEFNTLEREKQGIRQFDTAKECIKALGDMPRAFEFAVTGETAFENPNDHDLFLKSLPWRVILISASEQPKHYLKNLIAQRRITCSTGLSLDKEDDPFQLLKKCWDAWMRKRWLTREGESISFGLNLYFEKNEVLEDRFDNANKDNIDANHRFNLFKMLNSDPQIVEQHNAFDVFYDRHGVLLTKITKSLPKGYPNLSWIYLDKNNPDLDLIASEKLDYPEISFSRLIESGVHKILIIDERAREKGIKEKEAPSFPKQTPREKSYILFAMASRVFIADSLILNKKEVLFDKGDAPDDKPGENLLQVSLSQEEGLTFGGKYKSYTGFGPDDLLSEFDTVIIHRTMLSKIINENCFDVFKDYFPNIVVTTGGGNLTYPEEVMSRIRMMPFSSLSRYLLNGAMAKNCLTNIM